MTRLYVGCGFFFFQAEDGIRDDLVTGVQTCALPISQNKDEVMEMIDPLHDFVFVLREVHLDAGLHVKGLEGNPVFLLQGGEKRSEERRVGKECRSRWSPYH